MKRIFLSLFILILFPEFLVAGVTDYYDRVILTFGVEKGILYSSKKTSSTPLYMKGGFGYGLDDNKIVNLNMSLNSEIETIYVNPEFMLLLNEFSRIKFFLTAGPDFGLINNFETGFRTTNGIIFDLFKHLSLSLGIDTRFNIYREFYIVSCGIFSFIVKI